MVAMRIVFSLLLIGSAPRSTARHVRIPDFFRHTELWPSAEAQPAGPASVPAPPSGPVKWLQSLLPRTAAATTTEAPHQVAGRHFGGVDWPAWPWQPGVWKRPQPSEPNTSAEEVPESVATPTPMASSSSSEMGQSKEWWARFRLPKASDAAPVTSTPSPPPAVALVPVSVTTTAPIMTAPPAHDERAAQNPPPVEQPGSDVDDIPDASSPYLPSDFTPYRQQFTDFERCLAGCDSVLQATSVKTISGSLAVRPEKVAGYLECAENCVRKHTKRPGKFGPNGTDGLLYDGQYSPALIKAFRSFTILVSIFCLGLFIVVAARLGWLVALKSRLDTSVPGVARLLDRVAESEAVQYAKLCGLQAAAMLDLEKIGQWVTIVMYQAGQIAVYVLSMSYVPTHIAEFFPWSDAALRSSAEASRNSDGLEFQRNPAGVTGSRLAENDPLLNS